MKTREGLKVGDSVWIFDINSRHYGDERRTAPIWSRHFVEYFVVGETSRSFLLSRSAKSPTGNVKLPKKGDVPFNAAYSVEEIDEQAYVETNAHRIGDYILRQRGEIGAETLREVARLVGYVEKTNTQTT